MSKQKKEKQPPVLGRLLEYAGGHKWLSVLGCGLSGVSAAVGIFPFVFVWYAARGILTPGGGVPAGLARYGWYALAAALLSAAIYFAGLMCTHLAAFRVATNMRKAAVAHLVDLPLGYFNANLTGRLRKQIDDNAALTETLLAHTIPDAVGGIVTPILAVVLLFVFDWRMGLACLIPMINMIKARIRPYFAPLGLQLREVTPQHIEDFYQSILADGCTTNTVIHYHAIIRKALQTAVKKDILLKNPADKVDRPKKNVFHGSFYSEEEMLTLFDAVSGDPLELCVKIAAYYGLRRSEVLGLRWSAIDMEHKTISISHKVIEAEVDGKFVPMGEDVLKTKSSFRTLPLIPAVGIILLEEKEKQEMYRRLFKKSYCRDYLDYICVDQCGKLLRPNYVTEHFSWLIEKYGLRKVRFHDLRHTCASLLLSNGISMKQIQIWLGHSTFSTTADIYAHLDYSAQEASANAMNGMFNRPEKEEQLA